MRRNWLALGAGFLVLAIAALLLFPTQPAPASSLASATSERLLPVSGMQDTLTGSKPNVIVILTDDQPVGYEKYMPRTMELFEEAGVQFTNAHSLNSTCCPARSTLLTGKNSPTTGVWTNWAPEGGWEAFYKGRWEGRTLAMALDRRGYRTALVGKYLNGYDAEESRVALTGEADYVPPGWDVWFSRIQREDGKGSYYNYRILSKDEDNPEPSTISFGASPADYSTDVLGEKAVDIIQSTPQETPLFLMWTPNAPHDPYTSPPGAKRVNPEPVAPYSLNDKSGKPPWIANREPVTAKKSIATQKAQIKTLQSVDIWVEKISAALKASGKWENTVFVFASDNGYFVGQYGLLGMKNHPHPPSTHVPLMVVAPSLRNLAGSTDKRLVTLADIPATIALEAGLDGSAMDGLALNAPQSTWRTGALVTGWRNRGSDPAGNQPEYCAWRTQEWLFIQYSANSQGEGYRELYNLTVDANALVNLAGTVEAASIEEELAQLTKSECRPAPPGFVWPERILIPVMAPDLSR